MKQLIDEEKVIVLSRPADKKKVVFYHDHTADFEIDPEFQKLWRSVAVDSVDDDKIHEYLEKQGIRSMEDQAGRKLAFQHRKPNRKAPQRKKRAPKDNEHMASVLEDYSELTAERFQKKWTIFGKIEAPLWFRVFDFFFEHSCNLKEIQ